jgi:hypothetical protein
LLGFSHVAVIDDAYISFRYAHNLVEGEGLVFNPGERVEGFTNLLWTLMMTVPEVLGLPVHIFAAFLGGAFGLLALAGTWRICCRLGISSWGTAAALLSLGLYPEFWLSATMGLEGGLFAFLLTCTVYLTVSGRPVYAGLCGGLLFATRPDSLLIIPICALYLLVAPENRAITPRDRLMHYLLPLLIPWLTLFAALTVWRLAYYGAWLPNTITAKSVPPAELKIATLGSNVFLGLRYWVGFLVSVLPMSLGAALVLLMRTRLSVSWLCLAILATQVPVVLANGGDWMPYYRLLAVYTPLFALLLGLAVDGIAAAARSQGDALRLASYLCFGGLLVAGGAFMLREQRWDATLDASVTTAHPCWQHLAEVAQPVLLPSDRVSPEALGVFSYMNPNVYSDDLTGLTNRYVARHGTIYIPRFGKAAPGYTYHTIRPNLIVVQSGFGWLSLLARASDETYNDRYSTYLLASSRMPAPCSSETYIVSIRKGSVARMLPAFKALGVRAVTVPKSD